MALNGMCGLGMQGGNRKNNIDLSRLAKTWGGMSSVIVIIALGRRREKEGTLLISWHRASLNLCSLITALTFNMSKI
jgi:hypothetical protein